MATSVWGVEHGPELVSKKREEYTRSMRKEGLAYNKAGARKRVRQDMMRRAGYYTPRAGDHRKENWKTVGQYAGRGLGYGAGLGALTGAALTKGSIGGAFGGGYIGAQLGGSVGAYAGAAKVNERAMSGARRAALERGDIVRVGKAYQYSNSSVARYRRTTPEQRDELKHRAHKYGQVGSALLVGSIGASGKGIHHTLKGAKLHSKAVREAMRGDHKEAKFLLDQSRLQHTKGAKTALGAAGMVGGAAAVYYAGGQHNKYKLHHMENTTR